MHKHALRTVAVLAFAVALATTAGGATRNAFAAALPPGNTVEQWDKIAEDTIVGSGAQQIEGFLYMSYVSSAMYDAVAAIQHGGYKPLLPKFNAWRKASQEAAVAEAAYRTLSNYFPTASATLDPLYSLALSAIPDSQAKAAGQRVGLVAAHQVIGARTGDGRMTPIATTSTFPALAPAAGVWRLTAPFAPAQTPWIANVRPFVLKSASQFLPPPPPSLSSQTWMDAFNELKASGGSTSTVRTAEDTAIAKFWTANVVRQYNAVAREIVDVRRLDTSASARLVAMVNVIAADNGISVMYTKYHYLFWRPITAIDPGAVQADGFGSVPGSNDGNPATVEQSGWKPLLPVPNHPEYVSAHSALTAAMAQVFTSVLGTSKINLDITGFDAAGAPGNFNLVRHFATGDALVDDVMNGRVWGGMHYRFSCIAGAALGRSVAHWDLTHAFQAGNG
ncbi:MAG TPA: vanadium-dependent haloperoxidase [Gaiellaceae bacterium]|nr:vanadium-dependent haloperoxidase [Gaiellaceae bacterium]